MTKQKAKPKTIGTILKSPKSDCFESLEDQSTGKVFVSATAGAILGNLIVPGIGGMIAGGIFGGALGLPDNKDNDMAKIPVFYSFHFNSDVMRVQQVRNIGTIEGNAPTNPNEWEQLKRTGETAVKNWIDENMKYKRCVVVLIGAETYGRHWINYEIQHAWSTGKALMGIHIHNLRCPRNGVSRKGKNPFDDFSFNDGRKLSSVVPCYDPNFLNAYQDISNNISRWINHAIENKGN